MIAPEVVEAIGGPARARASLAGVKSGEFTCAVCRRPGQLGEEPAAVIVRFLRRDAASPAPVVRFAHPGCSGSRVDRDARTEVAAAMAVYAVGWLEPAAPHAVLLVGAVTRLVDTASAVEAADALTTGLHATGFVVVSDMATPPPVLPGLAVYETKRRLVVRDRDGHSFYDGEPVGDHMWRRVAAEQGEVRVVCASGLRLDNRDRDPMADLFTAIGRGHAVAATATYRPGPAP